MQRKGYELITVTNKTEDLEEGKYTTLYTDVGNFEILLPLDELLEKIKTHKDNGEMFRYKKLDEYSVTLQNFGELVLDLNNVKIMGYKEHHIIDNRKLQKQLEEEAEKKRLEEEKIKKLEGKKLLESKK